MKGFLRLLLIAFGLFASSSATLAQTDEWFVGSHPDYHGAMFRELDGVFVAIYVTTEPPTHASPLVMETMAQACDTKMPISLHSVEAILALGGTPEERLADVRFALESFVERSVKPCPRGDEFEAQLNDRFDDAYLALDSLLVEAGILPLNLNEELGLDEPASDQEESSE